MSHDPEHDWRIWSIGGADDAGPGAVVLPAADVRQRGRVGGRGAGPIPRSADGVRRRGDASRGSAASTGVRWTANRTSAVATAVWTSDRGSGTQAGRSQRKVAGHRRIARSRRKQVLRAAKNYANVE